MNEMKYITINKNRGWRGLAEVAVLSEDKKLTTKHIFSFSQPMWDDLIVRNRVVIASENFYYVIFFEDTGKLPRPDQQRSVLIKNYTAAIREVNKYSRGDWGKADATDYACVTHHIKNRNNHTTSDWNCIGIRVMPEI